MPLTRLPGALPSTARLVAAVALIVSCGPGARTGAQQRPAAAPATAAPAFTVEEVAPGVHALIPTKPTGFLNDGNVVFIVNDDDVVVVDTNLTPGSAEASVAALRRITAKPVRYVVNTHWHVDHVSGNQVYRRECPGVEFIGQALVWKDLVEKGAANRRDMVEQAKPFAAGLRQALADGKSLTGAPLAADERAAYEADVALIDGLVAAVPAIEIVPPTVVVDEGLTLHRGGRTIEIRRLGRSHTHGDLAVVLPAEGVVVTGDLLVGPVPIVGGDQSFPAEWAASLDRLLALGAKVYVPGHGPVYRGDGQVTLLRDFLRAVDAHAAASIARGETLEAARKALNVDVFRQRMAGDSAALRVLFSSYGVGPTLAAAYRVRGQAVK
jgi:glyoxylase-like metal-dependent hydrolase (beta-lactamase superfamily II)